MSSSTPRIYVLAKVNGAGKSSVGGATFRQFGGDYYNPDESARALMRANRSLTQTEANSAAWREGVRLLERCIDERLYFAFETTLGGNTIPRLLAQAATQGIEIHVWYAGLSTLELHFKRVETRVLRDGHDIPRVDIRRRYDSSRGNLIALLPHLEALRVYDNSAEADPVAGKAPKPELILHLERGIVLEPSDMTKTPDWARPIVAAALKPRLS